MTFRYLALGVLVVVCLVARTGQAQQFGPVSVGIPGVAAPVISPSNGLPLSDSALLHSGVSVEGGYDTNIFYNDADKVGSAMLRVNPFLDLTNTGRNGEAPTGLFFDLRAGLSYREYLTSDESIRRLRAVQPTASINLEHNSGGTVAIGFSDTYARLQDAPYSRQPPSEMIIRDNNLAAAQLRWSPGGGRLQGTLRLTNMIDWFETAALKAADSMTNEAMLDISWRWLPKTALYLQVRQGYITYLENDPASASGLVAPDENGKQSSYPLRAVVGIRGLITEKTSVAVAVGYQNAFYASGQSTSGFLGSTIGAAELIIFPLQTTKLSFGLHHDFQNSVIGNFFYDDGVYASLSHQLLGRLVAQVWGAYDHRRYYGLPAGMDPRIDDTVQATALLDFYLRPWAYIGASYSLIRNRSDYAPDQNFSGTNYTKQQIFAHVGLTY
jgi:hypothetical protein